MVLPRYQREENKRFFLNVKSLLRENGNWIWPDEMESFQLVNGKLVGTRRGINKVRRITDDAFVRRYFIVR